MYGVSCTSGSAFLHIQLAVARAGRSDCTACTHCQPNPEPPPPHTQGTATALPGFEHGHPAFALPPCALTHTAPHGRALMHVRVLASKVAREPFGGPRPARTHPAPTSCPCRFVSTPMPPPPHSAPGPCTLGP